jgi:hypothetical protein
MENKQTAVEWLEGELSSCVTLEDKRIVFRIAKAMEKEQIIEAFDNGIDHYLDIEKPIWGKDYYKETYES